MVKPSPLLREVYSVCHHQVWHHVNQLMIKTPRVLLVAPGLQPGIHLEGFLQFIWAGPSYGGDEGEHYSYFHYFDQLFQGLEVSLDSPEFSFF